jgi:hypothetical protein
MRIIKLTGLARIPRCFLDIGLRAIVLPLRSSIQPGITTAPIYVYQAAERNSFCTVLLLGTIGPVCVKKANTVRHVGLCKSKKVLNAEDPMQDTTGYYQPRTSIQQLNSSSLYRLRVQGPQWIDAERPNRSSVTNLCIAGPKSFGEVIWKTDPCKSRVRWSTASGKGLMACGTYDSPSSSGTMR